MALWIVATLVAYFVKGICGFANSLIFDTILSFGVNNVNISPIDLLVNYPSNIVMIVKNRKSLDWKIYLPLIVLVLAGSLPGALLLKNIDAGKIKLVFGFVVVLLGAEMFLRQYSHKKLKSSKIALALVGVIAGALCGLLGIGALLAAYVGRVTDDHRAFKANMNAVFFAENTFRVVLYSILGLITIETLKRVALLLPVSLIALAVGMRLSSKIDESASKKIISILLMLSGISLILANL
ncbi:MAG: sulfite exporter TauE/SafE family protein [Clostridia bacterium]|nr:sulfite exporter TauE/SafE family protein [Clostridia bacterium]